MTTRMNKGVASSAPYAVSLPLLRLLHSKERAVTKQLNPEKPETKVLSPFIHLPVHIMSICVSVDFYLSITRPSHTSIHACPSIHPSIHACPSIHTSLFINPSIHPPSRQDTICEDRDLLKKLTQPHSRIAKRSLFEYASEDSCKRAAAASQVPLRQ